MFIEPSESGIVLKRTFSAPQQTIFDALTKPEHLFEWMKPSNMSLAKCEIDLRADGLFRYVFARPSGRTIEVRGVYKTVDAPCQIVYEESYDFSPLTVLVTTLLEPSEGGTVFRQTIVYPSKQERDDDFEGVESSARELYANLERYAGSLRG